MAIQIEWRNGTAAAWTSANPILAQGEVGVETDTGQIKFGDGTTSWNSLAYNSVAGAAQTAPYRSLGDGSDGNVTISSGTTTLTRDMFYNNLTLSGTGIIVTSGYKIFVKNILNISSAAVGAIQWNGNAGGNASGATAGAAPAAQSGGSLGAIVAGAVGATGTTGAGANGTAGILTNTNGGTSGNAGNGGSSPTNGNGGNGGNGKIAAVNNFFSRFETSFLFGASLISGGPSAGSGGAGSGDNTNTGGGGGGSGSGGGVVAIFANIIVKSSSTLAGTIQANGGVGGNGGNSSAGVTGGGGGGAGAGGGWVYIAYNNVYGPVISGLIQANGGNGGNGGNGTGTGALGGSGGSAGTGGRINIFKITTSSSTNLIGNANTTLLPELVGTSPIANSQSLALPGGDGGFNGKRTASL